MTTLKGRVRRTSLLVLGLIMLGGPGQARLLDDTALSSQMAGMSETNLRLSDCQTRLHDLDALLQAAGFRIIRTRVFDDRTAIAGWYNPQRKTTALAFWGLKTAGNTFSAGLYAGQIPWTQIVTDR